MFRYTTAIQLIFLFIWISSEKINAYDYIGCFVDTSTRALNDYNVMSDSGMTVDKCINICKDKMGCNERYYAGAQYGQECFCGTDFNKYGSADNGDCDYACKGDANEKCGGFWRMSVYEIRSDYIGCFRDKSARALEFQADLGSEMTIDLCINACGPHGKYAGVQYSSQCFCGDDYDKYGALNEDSCNMKCTGDNSEICGGTWANAVYKSREPTYIGCYVDKSSRALSGYSYSDGSNMTPKSCINACIANNDGHKVFYAGVQYASQCFCGTDFSKYDSADEADCSAACTGDSNEKCGGTWRNSVYKIKIV